MLLTTPTISIGISKLVAYHLGSYIVPISVTDGPPSPAVANLHPPLVGVGTSPQTHFTTIAAIIWVWGRDEVISFKHLHPYSCDTTHHTLHIPHTTHTTHFIHHTLHTPHATHTTHFIHHTLHTPHATHTTRYTHHTLHTPHTSYTTHYTQHTLHTPHYTYHTPHTHTPYHTTHHTHSITHKNTQYLHTNTHKTKHTQKNTHTNTHKKNTIKKTNYKCTWLACTDACAHTGPAAIHNLPMHMTLTSSEWLQSLIPISPSRQLSREVSLPVQRMESMNIGPVPCPNKARPTEREPGEGAGEGAGEGVCELF